MKNGEDHMIQGLRSGHESAYKLLFRDYYRPLSVFALKYTGELELAKEIVQNLFVHLYENRATLVINNGEYEETVSALISVSDPRGGFCMESRVNQTGHYLSVPTDKDSLPHVDDMEERGKGFYKLTHYPTKESE